jgi:hypothetical protein
MQVMPKPERPNWSHSTKSGFRKSGGELGPPFEDGPPSCGVVGEWGPVWEVQRNACSLSGLAFRSHVSSEC